MTEGMELAVINAQNAVEIFTKGGLSGILDGIEGKVRAMSLDASTVPGRDEIRSVAYKVVRTKTALDAEAKKLTEGWRDATKQVNDERKRAQERLDALAEEIRAPLTAFENKEKNRVAAHEAALADLAMFGRAEWLAANQLQQALDGLPNIHAGREWEEFKHRADKERAGRYESLSARLAERLKHDADQAELARLRKEEEDRKVREREERLKSEAAEKARIEAERKAKEVADAEARRVIEAAQKEQARVRAEAERVRAEHERALKEAEATAKAKRDRLEAEARAIDQKRIAEENAKLDAERRLKESEQARIASEHKATADLKAAQEKAKKESEAAIARERARVEAQHKAEEEAKAKREADERHRNKIRSEIKADVENTAPHLLVDAIMDGKIRNVKVIF